MNKPKQSHSAERMFPIQGENWRENETRSVRFNHPGIPWDIIAPHEARAIENHDQTLERLAQRGGLSMSEAIAVLEDHKIVNLPPHIAIAKLELIVMHRLRAQLKSSQQQVLFDKDAAEKLSLCSAEVEVLRQQLESAKKAQEWVEKLQKRYAYYELSSWMSPDLLQELRELLKNGKAAE